METFGSCAAYAPLTIEGLKEAILRLVEETTDPDLQREYTKRFDQHWSRFAVALAQSGEPAQLAGPFA